MACQFVYDGDGKVVAIFCASPWGIGGYYHCHDRACECEGREVYGFPPAEINPEYFTPDQESCTPQELAAHVEALAMWRGRT